MDLGRPLEEVWSARQIAAMSVSGKCSMAVQIAMHAVIGWNRES